MANRLSATLFLLISAYLLYKSTGTLFGTFRTDETYYLQDAWASYMGLSDLRGLPPHFNQLVEFYWWATDGNVRESWNLRLLLPLVLIQGWTIFRITQAAVPLSAPLRSSTSLLVAAAFILVMCAFRGYEVRPEVLPNTFILLAAYWLLFIDRDRIAPNYNLILLATAGAVLIIAASMSFRHTLSAGAFLLLCTFYLLQTTKRGSALPAAIIIGSWIGLTIYLNVISFDLRSKSR